MVTAKASRLIPYPTAKISEPLKSEGKFMQAIAAARKNTRTENKFLPKILPG